jgi:hypothetical protein
MSNTASDKATSQSGDPIPRAETLHAQLPKDNLFRVLALDGGGAKGARRERPRLRNAAVTHRFEPSLHLVAETPTACLGWEDSNSEMSAQNTPLKGQTD